MNFNEARGKSIKKKLIGVSISAPAILSTVISVLKMIYFRLDDGSQIGGAIARPFKQLVLWIHENTQFFSFFWKNSPTPNHMDFFNVHNAYFLAIYLMVFVGFAWYASGKKLSIRLAKINEKIENQLIEESIKGAGARSRDEIERVTEIPSSSIFSQFHQLYLAPVATATIGAVLIKLLGM